MMKRRARHDRVGGPRHVIVLEFHLGIAGPQRRLRVDADRLIAAGVQHGDETAQRPAPDLRHPGRRGGQAGPDERPCRSEPSLIGGHPARAYARCKSARLAYHRPRFKLPAAKTLTTGM